MLRSATSVLGYHIDATDGVAGKAYDFYFDDADWLIRYLVASAGTWSSRRRVLIPPASLGQPDWQKRSFPVKLSKEQVVNSPEATAAKPGCQRYQAASEGDFGWPTYWQDATGSFAPVAAAVQQVQTVTEESPDHPGAPAKPVADPHLRSLRTVCGFHICATDGEIGHVEDLIVDDENWAVHHVVLDTRNWLPGSKVLVEPATFDRIRGDEARAYVALDRAAVRRSPTYDPSIPINRDQEGRCCDYHGRPEWV